MEVYFLTVHDTPPHGLVKVIKKLLDGVEGIRILTKIDLHSDDRSSIEDYDKKIAFNTIPETKNVYRLGTLPVYIDNRNTTMYFGHPLDFYCISSNNFKLPNAWNIIKTLLPKPEIIYNPRIVSHAHDNINKSGSIYVDTSVKKPMFDSEDFTALFTK